MSTRTEFAMSVGVKPHAVIARAGALTMSSEPPGRMHTPMFGIEVEINGDWQAAWVTDLRRDEGGLYVLSGQWTNDRSYAVQSGRLRIVCMGREMVLYDSNAPGTIVPRGLTITVQCPFNMG